MNPDPMPFIGRCVSGSGQLIAAKELRQRVIAITPARRERSFSMPFRTTLMLTTAAPFSATNPEKSGNPVTRAEGGAGLTGTFVAAVAAPARPVSALER